MENRENIKYRYYVRDKEGDVLPANQTEIDKMKNTIKQIDEVIDLFKVRNSDSPDTQREPGKIIASFNDTSGFLEYDIETGNPKELEAKYEATGACWVECDYRYKKIDEKLEKYTYYATSPAGTFNREIDVDNETGKITICYLDRE